MSEIEIEDYSLDFQDPAALSASVQAADQAASQATSAPQDPPIEPAAASRGRRPSRNAAARTSRRRTTPSPWFRSSLQSLGRSTHEPLRSLRTARAIHHSAEDGFPAVRTQRRTVSESGPRPEGRGRQPLPSFPTIRAGARCSYSIFPFAAFAPLFPQSPPLPMARSSAV
ncbi:translation initiation factor IF-2-like protein [Labeo rohita]|uniref:Translation initiation factor IF-2-like protein n=1 Tax=Labeo rohita TaxID=84645 RepID=A0A498L232_LABRO|nr:translation initiation factor IF-2-like protein [Labeo rohita]RXN28531.1 translation initiation factor IF-2-like protein [Labeo rohita]